MGTNYYHRTSICECCNRYDEQHICKSHTTFQAKVTWLDEAPWELVSFTSWAEWREHLLNAPGEVWDEYGNQHDIEAFIANVEHAKDSSRRRQHEWVEAHAPHDIGPPGPDTSWLDADGFSFTGRAFT